MPSAAYKRWRRGRAAVLDEVEAAYSAIGGSGRARFIAGQQVTRAYAVLLSAEFQGFCKDLHLECVERLLAAIPAVLHDVIRRQFLLNRALDRGNPNAGNIGSDFGRFGPKFWDEAVAIEPRVSDWRFELQSLNEWRNAIAHHDYEAVKSGDTIILKIRQVRAWRRTCGRLARAVDNAAATILEPLLGSRPW